MQGNVIKSISNINFRDKISSNVYYYTIHFTENKIIWEFTEEHYVPFSGLYVESEERKNAEQMPERRIEDFEIEYWQIEGVEVKKGKFIITLMREYPLMKKKHTVRFDKKDQFDVESIFLRMLPGITIIKDAG